MSIPPPVYDYNTSIDSQLALNASRELVSMLNLTSNGGVISAQQQGAILNNSFPGYTRDDLASMEQVLENMDHKYRSMLTQITQTNNLMNINSYASNVYETESARMAHLRDQSVNNVYKMREGYMTNKYHVSYTQFITRITMLTLAIVILCAVAACLVFYKNMLSMRIAVCIAITLVLIYLFIVALLYRKMLERRKDDWTKFYFPAPAQAAGLAGGGCSA